MNILRPIIYGNVLVLFVFLIFNGQLVLAAQNATLPSIHTCENSPPVPSTNLLEQRIVQLEQQLAGQASLELRSLAAIRQVDDRAALHVTFMGLGMSTLGVICAVLTLYAMILGYTTFKSARDSLKKYEDELKQIVDSAKKSDKEIKEIRGNFPVSVNSTEKAWQEHMEKYDLIKLKNIDSDVASPQVLSPEVVELRKKAIESQKAANWEAALAACDAILSRIPDDRGALYGGALASLQLAFKSTGEKEQQLYCSGEEYLKKIQTDKLTWDIFFLWGILLSTWGKTLSSDEDRKQKFILADEKFSKATELNKTAVGPWDMWGSFLVMWASKETGSAKYSLYLKATEIYRLATENISDYANGWTQWGMVLTDLAKLSCGHESTALRLESEDKFSKAIQLNSDDAQAWSNWGDSIKLRAEESTCDDTKEQLFSEAEEKFYRATIVDSNYADAWIHWGQLLSRRVNQKIHSGDDRAARQLLAQAEEKFRRATDVAPDDAFCWYNLAWLAAYNQTPAACVAHLQRCDEVGGYLSLEDLDGELFDSVRTTPEFKAFYKQFLNKNRKNSPSTPSTTP